jgi:hypothetical protein
MWSTSYPVPVLLVADFSRSIIAVPGIEDNALDSWASPDGQVRLFDFLPEDIRNLQVLLYGHSTTRRGDSMDESIDELGDNLLEHINAFKMQDGASNLSLYFLRYLAY